MKIKFIGLDGFKEIENLSDAKKSKKVLHLAKKAMHFTIKANTFMFKKIKFLCKKCFFKTYSADKKNSINKNATSVLDKCYYENRNGSNEEFSISTKEILKSKKTSRNVKNAHMNTPKPLKQNIIVRKKAIVSSVACFVAVLLSCMTVASAIEFPQNTETKSNQVIATTSVKPENLSTSNLNKVADEEENNVIDEASLAIASEVKDDNLITDTYGLLVDGKLIGVTNDLDSLKSELNTLLEDAKKGYDDETTTEFSNDVQIKADSFKGTELKSSKDIIDLAKDSILIALSTDISYTQSLDYSTKVEYDSTKTTDYSKTKTNGKAGKTKVNVRTTFVNGIQTNAVVTKSETITKPVDKVIVKGSKKISSTGSGTFGWPVPYTHNITSPYEWRWGRMHWGIDISAGGINGQPIVASDSGKVTLACNQNNGYGNYIIIDHNNGYQTVYGHCSSLAVSVGQTVEKGATIGYVGSTGNSTGPHLHFEIRKDGAKLNPSNFVK